MAGHGTFGVVVVFFLLTNTPTGWACQGLYKGNHSKHKFVLLLSVSMGGAFLLLLQLPTHHLNRYNNPLSVFHIVLHSEPIKKERSEKSRLKTLILG